MNEVETLLVQLENIKGQIENLKLQHGVFISRFESEQNTMKSRHTGIDKDIDKVSKEMEGEIQRLEKELHDIVFNRETGIAFVIDRLLEKDKKREAMKGQLVGLWIGLGLLILKETFDLLTHKN